MAGLIFVLDTNTIAELFDPTSSAAVRMRQALQEDNTIYICQPVDYEVMRGLLKVNATRKLEIYREQLLPTLDWLPLTDADWRQAAKYWAQATRQGRQFSDVDLLVAAVATRLTAIIASSDADFDALPVKRVDWHKSPR